MKRIILALALLLSVNVYASELVEVESLQISLTNSVVGVGSTATKLPTTPLSGRKVLVVQNIGAVTVYIGTSTVTANELSTGGIQLQGDGDSITMDVTDDIDVYGIIASGTSPVSILEIR